VSCELACDVARAITARSGALPGEQEGSNGVDPQSSVALPNLGPVQRS
jgi:hypothetical protein